MKYSAQRHHVQRGCLPQPDQAICRSPSTPEAAPRASCSTCPRRTRPASRPNLQCSPLPGLDLSLAGSYVSAEFDSTVADPVLRRSDAAFAKGNRLPTVPKFQLAATATYGHRFSDNAEWYVDGQLPACRQPLHAAERPGAGRRPRCQQRHLWSSIRSRNTVRLNGRERHRLAEAAVLRRSSTSRRVSNGTAGSNFVRYVKQPVRHEPEALVRPRARLPCAPRLQLSARRG